MTARTFSFSILPDLQPGSTVIDQMVAKMTEWQLENGGQAVYSFQLDDAAWHFLGENHPERLPYKPAGTVEINDFISPRGASTLVSPGERGFRAFEGGLAESNLSSLQGRGGAFRCFWDDAGDAMWHSAGSTGSTDRKQNLMKYNAATDEFLHWTAGGDANGPVTVDTTYFAPTITEFEGLCAMREAGYYDACSIRWEDGTIKNPTDPHPESRTWRVVSSTPTAQNRMRFVIEPEPGATGVQLPPAQGDAASIWDSKASLWPGYGMAHNFGTSAWDASRRRLYRMLRPNTQGTFFWVGEMNVGDAQSYTSREAWLADRERWIIRRPESFDFTSTWPQTVYAPEFDSLIILVGSTLRRYNCATREFSRYSISFLLRVPRSSHASEGAAILNVGPVLFYRDRSMYLASHAPGSGGFDRTLPAQFWRFDFSADGNTVSGPVQLAPCPVPMTLAGYSYPGDHTEFCMLGGELYAFHGDLRDSTGIVPPEYTGGVYRYNFGTDTWSDILPGSESWCKKLLDMGVDVDSEPHNWTVTEIPRLGVFLIAQAFESTVFGSFLFKPPLS